VDAYFDESAAAAQLRLWLTEGRATAQSIHDECRREYWLARLDYMQGLIEGGEGAKSTAKTLFERAIESTERAVACRETSESRRLLADCYAQILPYRGVLYAMRTGRRIMENAERAVELDPDNTRALITLALSYLHAPAFAGGSVEAAIEMLESVRAEPRLPRVEAFSANVWLAVAYQKLDRPEKAQPYLEAASRIYPGNTWVHEIGKP
jgi:tetratricopeptide (TPR) repeat protein